MGTREDSETPAWVMAVLFWRKVEMLERRGIPGARREADLAIGGPKR